MPTKLKDLKITKVDFVDAGANPGANILLFKHREGAPAAAATNPPPAENGGEKHEGALKRFFGKIAKAIGITDDELDDALEAIEKDAATFDEKLEEQQRRKTADEIWDYCWMLQDSLCSIFWDDEVQPAEKAPAMEESLAQFVETVKAAIPKWAEGKPTKIAKAEHPITAEQLELAKRAHERLGDLIAKATKPATAEGQEPDEEEPVEDGCQKPKKTAKGAQEDMKIDKSKLTPEELAALEAIEKKAGIQEDPAPEGNGAPAAAEPTATHTQKAAEPPAAASASEGEEDIYKGLHPAVKAELERLRKQADTMEERELQEVAKKYEIIGKKADELVPTLKTLKAAGGDTYDQMIAVLDASVAAVEKSGLFSEVGKRGGSGESDAWAAIEKHAETIQKSAPNMTWSQAVDKACEQHPDLVHDYESGR